MGAICITMWLQSVQQLYWCFQSRPMSQVVASVWNILLHLLIIQWLMNFIILQERLFSDGQSGPVGNKLTSSFRGSSSFWDEPPKKNSAQCPWRIKNPDVSNPTHPGCGTRMLFPPPSYKVGSCFAWSAKGQRYHYRGSAPNSLGGWVNENRWKLTQNEAILEKLYARPKWKPTNVSDPQMGKGKSSSSKVPAKVREIR